MKKHRVILKGVSEAFTGGFRKIVEECGIKAVLWDEGLKPAPSGYDIYIYEAAKKAELKMLASGDAAGPFFIFTSLAFTTADVEGLKRCGLVGIMTRESSPEEVAFLINNALFYDRMIRRNPRAPVSMQVTLSSGGTRLSAVSSLLSRDGMFIVTLHPLPASSVCELAFSLPGSDKELKTEARVLYNISINRDLNIIAAPKDPFRRLVTHPGMAVFFTDLSEADRRRIDEYVKSVIEPGQ